MRLMGKVALISGGARGMGASEARLFAREGARVVIGDILEAEGRAIEADIQAKGGEALFVRLDVTDEADWDRAVTRTIERFERLNVLVNNAGVGAVGRIEDTTAKDWDHVMDINAKGVFLGMKMAVPEMRKNGGGSIVNISSISGFVGQRIVHMGYNASKGAVRLMTKAVAVQFARDNVRVNSVHPGVMPPMRTSKLTGDPEVRKKLINAIPMGRAGRVEEVANASLFLASDDASYITGTEIVVDGGYLAQ